MNECDPTRIDGTLEDDYATVGGAIEQDLNDAQLKAVKMAKDANVQVIAGPGTGKTKTLVNRLLYLITECNVEPEKVLVLTFTNRAVQIFRDHLFHLAPSLAPRVQIHTFHSYCQSLISKHWEERGFKPGWVVADDLDQEYILIDILKDVMGTHGRDYRKMINKFLLYKRNTLVDANFFDEKMDKIYQHYQAKLDEMNMIDYDGILKHGYELAKKYCNVENGNVVDPPPSHPLPDHFANILIDEFQDANLFQWNLARLISKKSASVTIVGDPDQSIFSFQGANANLLETMKNELPNVQQVVLTQNYRSSQEIVDAASSIIREDATHFLGDDQMPVGQFNGAKPIVKKCLNPLAETTWVANKIHHLILNENIQPCSIAVLVRTNIRKDSISSLLRQKGIEVSIYGPLSLLKSPYIRPLYAFLKFIQSFDQDIQLLYMLRNPNKILSPKQLSLAKSFSESRNIPLWEALQQNKLWLKPSSITSSSTKSKKTHIPPDLDKFLSVIEQSSEIIHSNVQDPDSLVKGLQLVSKYLNNWPSRYEDKAQMKQQELFDLIVSIAPSLRDESFTLSSSLIAHTRLQDIMAKPNEIVVSTIHNAKGIALLFASGGWALPRPVAHFARAYTNWSGLEWDNVFVMDATDTSFPHVMSESEKEERRILYVGLTRAKSRLFVSYPVSREWPDSECKISRFLSPNVLSNFDMDLADSERSAYQQRMLAKFEDFNRVRKERPNIFKFPEGSIIRSGRRYSTVTDRALRRAFSSSFVSRFVSHII